MCKLKKLLISDIFSTPAGNVYERLKTNGTVIEIAREIPTINKRNIIQRNIYRDNNFHSRRQVLNCV